MQWAHSALATAIRNSAERPFRMSSIITETGTGSLPASCIRYTPPSPSSRMATLIRLTSTDIISA